MNFIDVEDLSRLAKVNSSEWRRLHFRNQVDTLKNDNESPRMSPTYENQKENLMKRLSMYDSPSPFPLHKSLQTTTTVIPLCDTWFCDIQTFESVVGPYVYSLQSYGK